MAYDKKTFLKDVTVLCDDREKENSHIITALDNLNISHDKKHLPFGDYSFFVQDRDFSLSCVIERKRNVDELYGNLTIDRERIEKEFATAVKTSKQFILLIENCKSLDELKNTVLSEWQMRARRRQIAEIGKYVYSTIQSWQCGNRYNFRTVFCPNMQGTAVVMLEQFYWYWRNYKIQTASRRNKG